MSADDFAPRDGLNGTGGERLHTAAGDCSAAPPRALRRRSPVRTRSCGVCASVGSTGIIVIIIIIIFQCCSAADDDDDYVTTTKPTAARRRRCCCCCCRRCSSAAVVTERPLCRGARAILLLLLFFYIIILLNVIHTTTGCARRLGVFVCAGACACVGGICVCV